MAVESVSVFDRHGRPIPAEGDAVFAGKPSAPGRAAAPAKHSGGFVVNIDPDVFESDADAVARWLTDAGLGHFAVSSAETVWPADLTPDQVHLRSMLRRVRLLQLACRLERSGRAAVATLIDAAPTEPPPRSARAAKAKRKAQTKKAQRS